MVASVARSGLGGGLDPPSAAPASPMTVLSVAIPPASTATTQATAPKNVMSFLRPVRIVPLHHCPCFPNG
jgi:hypothetical protein